MQLYCKFYSKSESNHHAWKGILSWLLITVQTFKPQHKPKPKTPWNFVKVTVRLTWSQTSKRSSELWTVISLKYEVVNIFNNQIYRNLFLRVQIYRENLGVSTTHMEKASSQANWAPEPVRVCFRWLGSSTWDKDLVFWLVNIRWTYSLRSLKTSCENSDFWYAFAFFETRKCWKNIERILKEHWKNIEWIFDSILLLAQHRAQDTALKFLLVWIWLFFDK